MWLITRALWYVIQIIIGSHRNDCSFNTDYYQGYSNKSNPPKVDWLLLTQPSRQKNDIISCIKFTSNLFKVDSIIYLNLYGSKLSALSNKSLSTPPQFLSYFTQSKIHTKKFIACAKVLNWFLFPTAHTVQSNSSIRRNFESKGKVQKIN